MIKFFRERSILSSVLVFGLWVNFLPLSDTNIGTVRQYSPLETTISNQKALAVSGEDGLPGLFPAKREKFDLVLHARLMKTFPDWPARMDYQKKQEEFYKSVIKKQIQLKRVRIQDNSSFYTKTQDSSMKPNIFDTGQSFLMKMYNPVMRKNFIKILLV